MTMTLTDAQIANIEQAGWEMGFEAIAAADMKGVAPAPYGTFDQPREMQYIRGAAIVVGIEWALDAPQPQDRSLCQEVWEAAKRGYARALGRVAGFIVMEFWGKGDPMFGGTADDRTLGTSGEFLTGCYRQSEVALFNTPTQARKAYKRAARRPNSRISILSVVR